MLETAAKRIKTSASLNQRPAKCWPSVFLGKDKYSATLCEKLATKDRTMSSILPGKAGIKQFALMVDGKMVFEAKDLSHAGFSTCSAAGGTLRR